MTATPYNMTITAVGASGRVYCVDVYASDVNGEYLTFNPSGAAGPGSLQYWRAPENITIVDISSSASTDTKGFVFLQDGQVKNGGVIRIANFLNTLQRRSPVNLYFPAGSLIGGVQF
jgi:hypothetical protein